MGLDFVPSNPTFIILFFFLLLACITLPDVIRFVRVLETWSFGGAVFLSLPQFFSSGHLHERKWDRLGNIKRKSEVKQLAILGGIVAFCLAGFRANNNNKAARLSEVKEAGRRE